MNKKRLMGIAGLASALLLMGSCTSELSDDPVMTEAEVHRGEVTFRINGISNTLTRADDTSYTAGDLPSSAIENNVKKLYAIIFKANTSASLSPGAINDNTAGLTFHRWIEINLGSDGNLPAGSNDNKDVTIGTNKEFSFRLKDNGKYAVLFLANATDFITSNIATLGEKNKFIDNSSAVWYNANNTGAGLSNKLIQTSVSTENNLQNLTANGLVMRSQLWFFNYDIGAEKIQLSENPIPLKRLCARIDVSNESSTYITLQRVCMKNRRTSSLLGVSTSTSQSTAVDAQTNWWQFNAGTTNNLEAMIYTYENDQKNQDQIPSLVIEYNIVGETDIRTAEVFLQKKISEDSDEMVPVTLQRNHLYKVKIKVDAPEQPFEQGVIVEDYTYGDDTKADSQSIGNTLQNALENL